MTKPRPEVRPNLALREARGNESFNQVAARLCAAATRRQVQLPDPANVKRHYQRIETGKVGTPTEPYLSLICETMGRSPLELFGRLDPDSSAAETFSIRSHKFVPTFIGADNVAAAREHFAADAVDHDMACAGAEVDYGDSSATLYLFPFGVALFHVIEDLAFESVAGVARWRRTSYEDALEWAGEALTRAVERPVEAGYVFSFYWIGNTMWSSDVLLSAMRLLSMPEVIFSDQGPLEAQLSNAEAVERSLLRDGFEHPEIVDYGIMGISIGCASWSAVAYHALAPARALDETTHVEVELRTQAVWCYCRAIHDQVEDGQDPDVPDGYGWRYLRAMRSKAISPGAQEPTQSLSMRRAIFATSHLDDQLTSAIECLR